MAPSASAEEDDDLDEVLDLEPRSGSGRRRGRRERTPGSEGREPVRRWRSSEESEEPWDEVVDRGRAGRRREKPSVFWRARDSLYFEPLVALAIIVLLLVSLFAYTSNWPPVYVVESNSMQHGSGDQLGDLNAGDIVLAQKASLSSIVTWVVGLTTGSSTYGSFGDVLIYYPNGSTGATPIIHRAIIYLQYDAWDGTYNATGLTTAECPSVYDTPHTAGNCGTTGLTSMDTLNLFDVGGRTVTVSFSCPTELGEHSGFLTLGDNNSGPDESGGCGMINPLSTLVQPGWVIGVARGMIPWFGALKLLLDGNAGRVPTASWEFLGLTVSGVIFAGAGIHILLRRRRARWKEARRRDDEEDEEEPLPKGPRGVGAVRPWKATAEPPGPAEKREPPSSGRMSHEQRRRSHFVSSREKRPARRPDKERKPSEEDDRSESAASDGGRSRL
jgi:signal peptidase